MLRLGFPVVGVVDLDRAAAFWAAALHLHVSDEWSSPSWRTLTGPGGDRVLGLMRSASRPSPGPGSTWTSWSTPPTSRTPRWRG